MSLLVPVSVGELFDKITILQIKTERITNLEALRNIDKELRALENICNKLINIDPDLIAQLKLVNTEIWEVEDELRLFEKEQLFDNRFVNMARSVYMFNDKRAAIKKKINNMYNSEIKEEKSYSTY
jgi:hypothetical protein